MPAFMQIDRNPILGDGGTSRNLYCCACLRARSRAFGIGILDVRRRAKMNVAREAINDQGIAGSTNDDIGDVSNGRDAARERRRDMAHAPDSEDQAANLGAIIFQQRPAPWSAKMTELYGNTSCAPKILTGRGCSKRLADRRDRNRSRI